MTIPTAPYDGLIERMEAVESSNPYAADGEMTTNWHRNPDGPEAAAAIRELVAERERLVDALEQIKEECANTGFGNPIVNERMIERIEETSHAALSGRGKP